MKIIFFGLGSIGKRHARILLEKYKHDLYAFRSGTREKGNELNIPEVYSWEEVDAIKPDIAFVTNPTSMHVDVAIACAQMGMHLFIEKPLDSEIEDLGKLLKIVSKKKLATYVAYVLRFHPVVVRLKKYCEKQKPLHMRVACSSYLPKWHPRRDVSKRYSSHKKMGGGVIYDLSHEIDYVEYILGDIMRIKGQFAQRSDITVDVEDYADILVETKKGPANIHINFFSHVNERKVQIDFKDRYIEGDLLKNTVTEYREGQKRKTVEYKGDISTCFEKQIRYFLKNLNNPNMMNSIFEGEGLIRKIYRFKNGK
ncbi:MAG: Gfo/Idh/MocA family oxidoreductase [Candidatus Omnitrophica bacterium]|nr:Gfo/Idh/MocA family oxidoreductase [Candidatus Omnitrophota bacterium]